MNLILFSTAASLGIFHTAIGVDHYIPFVAMNKSNNWSFAKTMLIVLICGTGHVLSSVILGFIGILIGAQIGFLVGIENIRGDLATWFLIAFGFIYMLWGIRNAIKNQVAKLPLNSSMPSKLIFEPSQITLNPNMTEPKI